MIPDAFVDAHVHFWDHAVEGLRWRWLEPGFEHPRLGGLTRLDAPRFAVEELRAEAGSCNVVKVVHVQAATRPYDPECETAWLQGLADRDGWPNAIVGDCRLAGPDAREVLERQARHRSFRGVRDLSAEADLGGPEFARGFAALASFGGVFELMVPWQRFEGAAALAARYPEVTLVVEHAGLPVERTDDYYDAWLPALKRLATAAEGSVCKISALAGADPRWTADSLRRWVLGCIEAFGPERCMFASNWPVDRLFGTYEAFLGAYGEIVSGFTAGERLALFRGTAERAYRI